MQPMRRCRQLALKVCYGWISACVNVKITLLAVFRKIGYYC